MSANTRVGWSDLLRCAAALAVVVLHAAGHFAATLPVCGAEWTVAILFGSLTRWAVPVFVMLSGMFLLDPARDFDWPGWRRRIVRLAVLTVVVVYLYALWDSRSAHFGAEQLLEALVRFVRGEFHYHLWFLPMLLGLYLLTPALRALVAGAERKTLWYVIGLWALFALALPFVYGFLSHDVFLPWFERTGLYGALGYAGYFLLGWLLRTCETSKKRRWALYALALLGWLVTFVGTGGASYHIETLELRFFSFFSPFVALTAVGVFLLFRTLDRGRRPVWGKLSQLTLWVYLLHPLLLELIL